MHLQYNIKFVQFRDPGGWIWAQYDIEVPFGNIQTIDQNNFLKTLNGIKIKRFQLLWIHVFYASATKVRDIVFLSCLSEILTLLITFECAFL